jgi:nucleoside-diphosphate-sugar epimerase
MRVLLTGSSGYLGSYLSEKLVELGYDVTGLDIVANTNPDIKFIIADITNPKLRIPITDIVIHAAAAVPITRLGKELMTINSSGTLWMLYAAKLAKAKKFIYISSSAVYGSPRGIITESTPFDPIETYGASKEMAEYWCKIYRSQFNMDISIIRPRTIIGGHRAGMLDFLFSRVAKNKWIPMLGDGSNRFQLVDIRDLCDGIVKVMNSKLVSQDYNLGTDKFTTLRNDLQDFIDMVHSRSRLVSLPIGTRRLLKVLDRLDLSPMTAWHYDTIFNDFVFDISKAKKELGWEPKYSNRVSLFNSYINASSKEGNTPHTRGLKKSILDLI